jgi:MtN3 and saliva related transmembrane protein
MTKATLIGILAASLTTFSWIPQAIKTIRTKRADDFSWSYLAMFVTGVLGWIVYGLLRNDAVVFAANAVAAVLLLPILIIKSRCQ